MQPPSDSTDNDVVMQPTPAQHCASPPASPTRAPSHSGNTDTYNVTAEPECWVTPESVGLYCEPQVLGHCAMHAWHAYLARCLAPNYFSAALASSHRDPTDPQTHFQPDGWYSAQACNHYMYEHNARHRGNRVAWAFFLSCMHRRYTKAEILSMAPKDALGHHCSSMLAWQQLPGGLSHFTCWRAGNDGQWYVSDSIAFGATGTIKKLRANDWTTFNGTFYSLIELDPLTLA